MTAGVSEAYTETVLDHFGNPRNVGVQADADAVGRAENPASGASMELYLRVLDGRIQRATFQIQGCTASIAAGSMATEMTAGRTVSEAAAITRTEIEEALGGLPATRKHAAALAEQAIRAAIADYGNGAQ
jgi:nitrogen fixation NifU-like protein